MNEREGESEKDKRARAYGHKLGYFQYTNVPICGELEKEKDRQDRERDKE